MKKIFIKISAKIYDGGIPIAHSYGDSSYRPIADELIEVMFEPGTIDERTHLLSIGCVGKIAATKTFSFSGDCEQSQIGDILLPSAELAVSIAKMLKDYFEHFKKSYNLSHIDSWVKKILDDITNNIPIKSIIQNVKVQNPGIYRQMTLEYKSRHGFKFENMLENLIDDQEIYTFSNFNGILRQSSSFGPSSINYKNIISSIAGMRRSAQPAAIPQPAMGAQTKGPDDKQNLSDRFPQFQQGEFAKMKFDRGSLAARQINPGENYEQYVKYTTDQLEKKKMTYRNSTFYIEKKLPGPPSGFYAVTGLDSNGKVQNVSVWGGFLEKTTAPEEEQNAASLKPGQKKRFMKNLGFKGTSKNKTKAADLLQKAASAVGLDYYPFIAYYKDALDKKAIEPFEKYIEEANNPSMLKRIWNTMKKGPAQSGLTEDILNSLMEKGDETAVKVEARAMAEAEKLFVAAFNKYSLDDDININTRARQLKITPDQYEKDLVEAGKNGMSVPKYIKNKKAIEKQDQESDFKAANAQTAQDIIAAANQDPYSMLLNMEKIENLINNKDQIILKDKNFLNAYNDFKKDEDVRTKAFLSHYGISKISGQNKDKILTAAKELEAKHQGYTQKYMPKIYAMLDEQTSAASLDDSIKNAEPYGMLANFDKIKQKLMDQEVVFSGNKIDMHAPENEDLKKSNIEFITEFNKLVLDEGHRNEEFLKYNGIPIEVLADPAVASQNKAEIKRAIDEFDSISGDGSAARMLKKIFELANPVSAGATGAPKDLSSMDERQLVVEFLEQSGIDGQRLINRQETIENFSEISNAINAFEKNNPSIKIEEAMPTLVAYINEVAPEYTLYKEMQPLGLTLEVFDDTNEDLQKASLDKLKSLKSQIATDPDLEDQANRLDEIIKKIESQGQQAPAGQPAAHGGPQSFHAPQAPPQPGQPAVMPAPPSV